MKYTKAIKCAVCGKPLIRRTNTKYCRDCRKFAYSQKRKKHNFMCAGCGKPFEAFPRGSATQRYCSRTCASVLNARQATRRVDIGSRFGQLVVLQEIVAKSGLHRIRYKCRCDCGGEKIERGVKLLEGMTKSCGCLRHRGRYKTGRWTCGRSGYVFILAPKQGNRGHSNYVLEHRLVMSKYIGQPLAGNAVVHHKNGIKDDNRIENLELRVINNHPHGQSVADMTQWCWDFLLKYAPVAKKLEQAGKKKAAS